MTDGVAVTEGPMNEEVGMSSDSLNSVGVGRSITDSVRRLELFVAPEGIESLRATLREFEARKTKLAEDHAKVDAVIDSLKKAMEVVLKKQAHRLESAVLQ